MQFQHGFRQWRLRWTLVGLGVFAGCATIQGPPPSDAHVTAALAAVETAEANHSTDPQSMTLRHSARQHYNAAMAAIAAGDNSTADMEFGLALADAELSGALARNAAADAAAKEAEAALQAYQSPTSAPAVQTETGGK